MSHDITRSRVEDLHQARQGPESYGMWCSRIDGLQARGIARQFPDEAAAAPARWPPVTPVRNGRRRRHRLRHDAASAHPAGWTVAPARTRTVRTSLGPRRSR